MKTVVVKKTTTVFSYGSYSAIYSSRNRRERLEGRVKKPGEKKGLWISNAAAGEFGCPVGGQDAGGGQRLYRAAFRRSVFAEEDDGARFLA